MVWAGVSANARTDLVFIDSNLNGQRVAVSSPTCDPIFQDARPYRAHIVDDYL